MHPVAAAAASFVAEHGLEGPVVVGASGGPDSTALLHALHGTGVTLHVAHLNHGLRGAAADGDADFVAGLAAELGAPCVVDRAELPQAAEDAARRARRAFLEGVADAAGARWIALGHTADDQAETVLHRVLRGSGLRGLAGMRPVAGRYVRPLLTMRRAAALDYLAEIGAAYRVDASNLDPAFTRNRIRYELLPRLTADYNPQVVEALNRLAEIAGAAEDWVAAEVAALDRAAVRRDAGIVHVDTAAVTAAPRFLRLALLRELAAEAAGGAAGVTFEHAAAVARLLEGAGPPVALPGGVVGRRSGSVVTLAPPPGWARWEVAIPLPGTAVVDGAGVQVALELVPPPADPATPPGEAYFDADRLEPPLAVRNRRRGDRFQGLGAPGAQKLKQFLSDRKVPLAARDGVPLLVDRAGIVCVLGHRIADRVKVTPDTTTCVHLVMTKLDPLP